MMLNSKYIIPLGVVSIVLTALLIIFIIYMLPVEPSDELGQPEYVHRVLDKDQVTTINIDIKQEDWDWLLANAAQEEYRSCNITINGTTYYNVGIRPKGNSSLNMIARDETTDRYSFKISFDEYIEGQTCYGLRKLALNNIMSDTTYMKEYLSYDMFAFMNIATPAYAYSSITINGEPWGLYLAVEVMEESFLQRNFGSTAGNLYKPESMDMGGNGGKMAGGAAPDNGQAPPAGNRQQGGLAGGGGRGGTNLVYSGDATANYSGIFNNAILKTTDAKDWQRVIEMIKNLNEGTNLEQYLDVEEILRYFAVNTFLVNLDSYAGTMKHNYYLYEEKGVFQILPWDFNLSFGGMGIQSAAKAINFPIDKPVTDTMENSPLIAKLLEVPEYKELYHQYLQELVVNYLDSGIYERTINKVDTLINTYVKNDATAFYTYEEYKDSLPELLQFGRDRAASIAAQLSGEQPAETYGTIATTVDLKALGSMGGGGGDGDALPGEKQNNNGQPPGFPPDAQQGQGEWQGMAPNGRGGENMPTQAQNGNFAGGNAPGVSRPGEGSSNHIQGSKSLYLLLACSIVFLLAALGLVLKFKRKKFRATP